ncbi:hypothetical protein SCP_1202860 [Sparassis crispa]|uniref:Uncharacterized protein n=1 Tax=Sparassis crispa TaxID=139825 RepID=A0A401H0V0_9APHY|nr:hypothetical protein SCP_1202860 [Sparassis crispa]GBE88057.1 hypothetical protein SCP_1202860 [Sparassis crispa]
MSSLASDRYSCYERDDNGDLIPHGGTGYKLTRAALEAEREIWLKRAKARLPAPTTELPDKYNFMTLPDGSPDPPSIQYGIAVKFDKLLSYAKQKNLLEPAACKRGVALTSLSDMSIISDVIETLEVACNARLHWSIPWVPDYNGMIALYSNYTMFWEQLEEEHEQEVIKILQEELGVTEKPMWYWDISNQ